MRKEDESEAEEAKSYLLDTEVIVQAGGKNERWDVSIPKAVTEIGVVKRPMIDWTIAPFVKAGVKKFYVTLWADGAEKIIERCEKIRKFSGIEFVYLREPKERRLGRAGIVKESLKEGKLDPKKPKIQMNCSDVINLDPVEFAKFHLEGVKKGNCITMVGSKADKSIFGIVDYDKNTFQVLRFLEKPIMPLPIGKSVNTAMFYFDSAFVPHILSMPEKDRIDFEVAFNEGGSLNHTTSKMRNYPIVEPLKSWWWFKYGHERRYGLTVDFEKALGIDIEKLLGPYEPES